MSVSLKEIFEGAGYNFEDREDLDCVYNILWDAEELRDEVECRIEVMNMEEDAEEGE